MPQFFRTVMQARGQREDGETFPRRHLLFHLPHQRRNAPGGHGAGRFGGVQDATRSPDCINCWPGSRIAIGAVSHEIRNFSGAIAAVHHNLSREGVLAGNRDFEALGNLIAALERIANCQYAAIEPTRPARSISRLCSTN